MTQKDAVTHWQRRASAELKAAEALFEKQDPDLYGEVLFHSHLALELALKAEFIRQKDSAAPFTHDLGELADALHGSWTQEQRDDFEEITEYAILSRYGDEEWLVSRATKEKAEEWLQKTKDFLSKLHRS